MRKYVTTLNLRSKWSSSKDRGLKIGVLVWNVEATSPERHYPLARVVKLNYGSEALARCAEVKMMSGNLIRWIVELAPVLLPPNPS